MGQSNAAVRQWLSDKERFADLFNVVLFGGEQVISSSELEKTDSEGNILDVDKQNKAKEIRRHRDIVMKWKQYITNYRINLIDAANPENAKLFQTDLQEVFGMLQYRRSKTALVNYMNHNSNYFKHVNRETYHVIRAFLNSEKMLKENIEMNK